MRSGSISMGLVTVIDMLMSNSQFVMWIELMRRLLCMLDRHVGLSVVEASPRQ